jgi:hypothetical protein
MGPEIFYSSLIVWPVRNRPLGGLLHCQLEL